MPSVVYAMRVAMWAVPSFIAFGVWILPVVLTVSLVVWPYAGRSGGAAVDDVSPTDTLISGTCG